MRERFEGSKEREREASRVVLVENWIVIWILRREMISYSLRISSLICLTRAIFLMNDLHFIIIFLSF